jgi:hypothetical protein
MARDAQSSGNGSTRFGGLWAPLVASCLLATSCSMVKTGYENLPMLAMWRVGSYVPLNAEQRQMASTRIEALHAWHRNTQLGGYVEILQSIQRQVADGTVDEAQIRHWRRELVDRWAPIAEQAAPAVAEVAGTLQPAQLTRLRTELDRGNDKLKRDWMPDEPAKRLEARTRRFVERAEFFLGDLTQSQRGLARRAAERMPPGNESLWMAQRVARQQDLLAVLERIATESPSPAVAQRWMHAHLMRYWRPLDPRAAAEVELAMAAGDALMASMLAEATPAQRRHLHLKLQDWIDALHQIRAAGRPAPVAQPA